MAGVEALTQRQDAEVFVKLVILSGAKWNKEAVGEFIALHTEIGGADALGRITELLENRRVETVERFVRRIVEVRIANNA